MREEWVVPPTESVDVLIVGAGLSGIGAAVHLQRRCPSKSFAILEARGAIGGTWDLFRFPGVRSDSDMYTLGYSFRPWSDANAIADGSSIRRYITATAREAGIDAHIRFGHRVTRASWSSDMTLWTIEALRSGVPAPVRLCCRFLYFCGGYFSYESAYRPAFPNEELYGGMIVHPQFWPEHLDYTGKRVIVVGSGATAVTLIPEMAKRTAHVTMLQRIALLRLQPAHGGRNRREAAALAAGPRGLPLGADEERTHRHGVLSIGPQTARAGQEEAAANGSGAATA